jgi:hypothetical protein
MPALQRPNGSVEVPDLAPDLDTIGEAYAPAGAGVKMGASRAEIRAESDSLDKLLQIMPIFLELCYTMSTL